MLCLFIVQVLGIINGPLVVLVLEVEVSEDVVVGVRHGWLVGYGRRGCLCGCKIASNRVHVTLPVVRKTG